MRNRDAIAYAGALQLFSTVEGFNEGVGVEIRLDSQVGPLIPAELRVYSKHLDWLRLHAHPRIR